MKKRIISILLSLCMVITFIPVQAFASGGTTSSGKLIISDKTYEIAPDIIEREYITNNTSLSAQQMGHVMEVKLGDNAQIIAGYNDYNIEAISSGSNWGMKRTTEQAQATEVQAKVNVVGAVNGDFFDMSNGRPLGALVMNGTVIQKSNRPCFYIDADGVPHITSDSSTMPEGVKEAVSGYQMLVQDGEALLYNDTTTNPRTAVGIRADNTVVFYMVDGRQAPLSVGMTCDEVAQTMIDLGCVVAMHLDGGGSSTFATQRAGESNDNGTAGLTLRCNPSDGYERTVSSSLLVVSTTKPTGEFDHAILSPNQEVYTPGSSIAFTAAGADSAGGVADLPDDGLSWEVTEGAGIGSIDAETGVFTALGGKIGSVTIALKYNGEVVGITSVEIQWPDKLAFNNSSVSLDFGESSDLTFTPTYQGRSVNYKDGDFNWTLSPAYYKYALDVEEFYFTPWVSSAVNRWIQLQLPVTGAIGEEKVVKVSSSDSLDLYKSVYEETSKEIKYAEDGTVRVSGVVTHKGSETRDRFSGEITQSDITEDIEGSIRGLQPTRDYDFSIGKFANNTFTADEDNSLKGTIKVSLTNDEDVAAEVDVIVGMEPYTLMDFEDHYDSESDTTIPAKEYWKIKVGASSGSGGYGNLTPGEIKEYLLWVRMAGHNGVIWPKDDEGKELNKIVSSREDSHVRFGENACRLAWDFTQVSQTAVASSEFGFSGDLWVDNIKPTKIGMWINVPKDTECTDSFLSIILKGNATKTAMDTAYFEMDGNGNYIVAESGYQLNGTTTYVRYYSYDADGNVTGSTLGDWAGKGWTWVEADISSFQMPIDLCRAYTVRVVSAQNCIKKTGYMYIDNLQFIYGTNPNDINNPVIESVTEKSTGINLKEAESRTTFENKVATFDIQLSDNLQTDKYATGIDGSSIKVYVDGRDYSSSYLFSLSETEFGSNVLFQTPELTNGQHSIKIRAKDYYGNETVETYSFIIDDEAGKEAEVTVRPQAEAPKPGGNYVLNIVNCSDQAADTAEITVEVSEAYAAAFKENSASAISYGECYEQAQKPTVADGAITVYARKKSEGTGDVETIATLTFAVPEDAVKGDKFTFEVPEASYSIGGVTETFSLDKQSLALAADYDISVETSIVNIPVCFTVTDSEGNAVKDITLYNGDGTVLTSNVFTSTGRKTVYAKDDNGCRSWNLDFVVCDQTTDGEGSPFGIQNNVSADGATQESITWLSAIGSSNAEAYIKFAKEEAAVETAENTAGISEYITFSESTSGNAFRMNSVKLTGLEENTTYYYQVGDGKKWSDVLSFTTAPAEKNATTNFFIFGDIQSNNTYKVSAAIENVTGAEKKYAFGIQTGDAIDNVTVFSNWRSFMTTINSEELAGIDVFHTLGNHEYYGDANGLVSGKIFGLKNSAQGSFNSAEYGCVYAAVINNGGNLRQALENVKEDAAKSSCAWKVLSVHEPIYGTNEEMNAETRAEITKLIEEAGFDFVFTGDDHAYARTYPMLSDSVQDEDSREGVVYYVCGDLSNKTNTYNAHDYFATSIPHEQYQGMYMTAEADNAKITISAYDYNGNLLDSYTEYRTDCEIGNHTFGDTSLYDLDNKTLTCTLCGEAVPAKVSGYTGRLNTAGGEGEVVLAAGAVKTGWFTLGEEILHAGENGLLHKTVTHDSATCTEDGHIIAECECDVSYTGDYTYSKGHTWDENHVCTVCGTQGISMDDVALSLNGKYWEYTGSNIRASANAMYGDYKLVATSDRTGKDAYKTYSNNKNVGMGTVTFEGRGDFYGTKSIQFPIVPKSVTEIATDEVFSTSAIIKWDAAAGAEYYRVYQKTSSGWTKVGVTENTSIIIQDLKPETEYIFKVASSTDVDGGTFNCLHWSNELTVTTKAKNESLAEEMLNGLKGIMDVNGAAVELPMLTVDGEHYMMLPANAGLGALQLNLGMEDESQSVTFIGSAGYQETSGNRVTVDIAALTGNANGTSQDIMLALPDCEPMTIHVMKSQNISALYLISDDPVSQGREYVDASKSNETTAKMTMVAANGSIVYDGNLTQIKARGNSTFTYYDKKSYQIKLDSKTDLLGTGEKVKTWVLLAGYGDATQMHDKLVKDLAAEMGMPYVASCDWIDLYYDGEYRGTYLLSEKNSVNGTGVDITDMEDAYGKVNEDYGDNPQIATGTNAYGQSYQYTAGLTEPENITGGYLIERNLNTIDEASGFYTRQGGGFNVKSPEYAGNEAMKYISEYYQEFEDAVYAQDEEGNYTGYNAETGKYYYDYCDMDSLVKVFLLQDLALNPDGFLSSCYFFKDADGLMYAGPVWDQEMAFGTGFTIKISPDTTNYHYLAEALIQIPDFKAAVEAYYERTFKDLLQGLVGDNGIVAGYQNKIEASTSMNYVMWPYVNIGSPDADGHLWADGTTYADVIADMQQWIGRRLNKLDTLYGDGTLHTEHTYTSKITKEPTYTEEGIRTYTCTVCGDTYTEAIPKLTMPSGGGGGAVIPPVDTDDFRTEVIEEIKSSAAENNYESEEQAALEQILEDGIKKIEAAKTKDEAEAIVSAMKKEIEALDTAEEKELIRSIEAVGPDIFWAKSQLTTLNGKTAVKVYWNQPGNIAFDGYDVFRSTKRYSGFGAKPFYTTKKTQYRNNKDLKAGNTYYYKVRAYKVVNGRKVYTKWSTKAWRIIK